MIVINLSGILSMLARGFHDCIVCADISYVVLFCIYALFHRRWKRMQRENERKKNTFISKYMNEIKVPSHHPLFFTFKA